MNVEPLTVTDVDEFGKPYVDRDSLGNVVHQRWVQILPDTGGELLEFTTVQLFASGPGTGNTTSLT